MATTPIFTKTFDFVTWLLAVTHHFPRSQRFVATKRLLDAALDFQELLVDANVTAGGRACRWHNPAWTSAVSVVGQPGLARHMASAELCPKLSKQAVSSVSIHLSVHETGPH